MPRREVAVFNDCGQVCKAIHVDGSRVVVQINSTPAEQPMHWFTSSVTPEVELKIELLARSMEPREAMLYRTCVAYQDMLKSAVWEIMRLEALLEDQQAQGLEPRS